MEIESANEATKPPVSAAALAAETGFNPASFKRTLFSRGIKTFRLREKSNAPNYVSAADAEAFKKAIDDERRLVARPSGQALPQRLGGVYCVEVPSYDGRLRVKIGWADSFDDRLSTYRTIVPDLRILALWPTRDQWMERAALKRAENIGTRVFAELFEFEDNAAATSRLNELFTSFGVQSVLEYMDCPTPILAAIDAFVAIP